MATTDHREMDAALRRTLRSGAPTPPSCDAEPAVAYVEGRLRQEERKGFETHMAECAGCRALAAAMVQELLPEASEPIALGRWWWSWRWAAPAMAGVAIVGSVVYFQFERVFERAKVQRTANAVVLEAPSTPEKPAIKNQAAAPRNEAVRDVGARAAPPKRRVKSSAVSAVARSDAVMPVPPPAAALAPPVAHEEARQRQQKQESVVVGAQVAAVKEKVGEQRGAEKAVAAPTRLLATSADYAKQPGGIAGAPPPQPAPLPEGAVLRAMIEHEGTLWAVSDGGRIFRSTDRGGTWTKIESPTTADLVRVTWEPAAALLVVEDKEGKAYRVKP